MCSQASKIFGTNHTPAFAHWPALPSYMLCAPILLPHWLQLSRCNQVSGYVLDLVQELLQCILALADIHQRPGHLPASQLQLGVAALHPDWATLLNALWALISQRFLYCNTLTGTVVVRSLYTKTMPAEQSRQCATQTQIRRRCGQAGLVCHRKRALNVTAAADTVCSACCIALTMALG